MQKILILASTFPRYKGDHLPKFVLNFAKLLVDSYEVHVLAPWAKGSEKEEVMDGVFVHRYKYFPGGGGLAYNGGIINNLAKSVFLWFQVPFYMFFQFLSVRRVVKNHCIELINAHWVLPQGLIAVLYRMILNRKIKIFCTSHGTDILGLNGLFSRFFKRFVLGRIDLLTVVSKEMKRVVLEMKLPLDVRVGPMSVDVEMFSPEKKDLNIKKIFGKSGGFLLFVGRINERKGIRYVISAMPEILKKFPLLNLLVIGDGPLKPDMENLCKDLGVSSNVVFLGSLEQKELPKYYASADVFLGTSVQNQIGKNIDTEGLGLVNAEAMSAGTFVVASDLPAIRDVVVDNVTGFVVPQKDSKAIAEKVCFVLENKEKLLKIKETGIAHVKKYFSKEAVSQNYKAIISELLSKD